jgi:mannitol/fructose-specific phosphotransferase system IIA component (Ntr-type)
VIEPNELIANPDSIVLGLQAATGEEAIRALQGELGAAAGGVADEATFLTDLLDRARLASVCIAPEVAMPHARTAAVSRMVLAVGRTVQGCAFDAEHPGVRLIFLIGTPRESAAEYLKMVAALSRMLRVATVREGLLAAKNEAEFLAWLARGVKTKR